jgi:hypothetical protein
MIGRSSSGPTASPALAMLVGGAVPGVAVGLAVAGVGAISGLPEAQSALAGAALAAAALAVGPVALLLVKNWPPPAVMLAAMVAYAGAILGVGVAYAGLTTQPWLRGGYAASGFLATLIAWLLGHVRAVSRLRMLAFGTDSEGDQASHQGANRQDGGSPASPSSSAH